MQIYKSILFGVFFLMGANLSPPIRAADMPGYTSGTQLAKICSEKNESDNGNAWVNCGMYVRGIVEGLQSGIYLEIIHNNPSIAPQDMHDKFKRVWDYCPPSNVSGFESARVVTNFMAEHPNDLSQPDFAIVMAAFINAWPCTPKK